jgi:hypothetical protein
VTTSVDELESLLQAEELAFFRDPNGPFIRLRLSGHNGAYGVVILVELDGRLVRFWAVGYGVCPPDHPHLAAVLRVLAEMNHRLRSTTFGWDSYCGEIRPYADLWLEDATLTRKQLASTLRAFLQGIDLGHARITKTMEAGADPVRPSTSGA